MSRLAIDGGRPEVEGPIRPFNTIGLEEIRRVRHAMQWNRLSGYLAGKDRGGPAVRMLEYKWAEKCNAKYAVACNSATSALLAACAAVGMCPTCSVTVPALTMSATAAVAALNYSDLFFCDVDEDTFCLSETKQGSDVIIATDLFGQPCVLPMANPAPDSTASKVAVIIDASQAPFARDAVGGDIDCYSLNVHKHLQTGEGGIAVTNDDVLAKNLRMYVNHGEMTGESFIGLNLRMTEITAAIALSQLERADEIIAGRVALAEELTKAVHGLPGLTPPYVRPGVKHVYYVWALKVEENRERFVKAMNAEGVPLQAGYGDPLYRLPAFKYHAGAGSCPVAERLQDKELVLFEVCAHDPTDEQIKQIGAAFRKVAEAIPCK